MPDLRKTHIKATTKINNNSYYSLSSLYSHMNITSKSVVRLLHRLDFLLKNLRTTTLKINEIINDEVNIMTNQNNNRGDKFSHTMTYSSSETYLQYSSIELYSIAIFSIYKKNIISKIKKNKRQDLKVMFNILTMLYFYKYFQPEHHIC